ncbi:MAG TPA: hypothetical protein VFF65_07030, partial [Phycisphaerales bacterium]|nr:hypothetical protein [Phycisphaerales bacterium]
MASLRGILPIDRWNVVVVLCSLLLLAVVSSIDFVTSWTLMLFYLGPVLAAAWLARGWWWVPVAAACAGAWYLAYHYAPAPGAGPETPGLAMWNTLVRLGILLVVGYLSARLRVYSR